MAKNSFSAFEQVLRKYTPEPLTLALYLTAISAVAAFLIHAPPVQILSSWGEGVWKIKEFTLQMVMILLLGHMVAMGGWIQKALGLIARSLKNEKLAVVTVALISIVLCWLNWGLGLVASAFLCRKIRETNPKVNYALLVATAYGGFVVWHGGLSGSIPLLIATPGNFSEKWIGRVIPVSETIFSAYNLGLILIVVFVLPMVSLLLRKISTPSVATTATATIETPDKTFSFSFLILGLAVFCFLLWSIASGSFRMDLDRVNLILLGFAFVLHPSLSRLTSAIENAVSSVGPILIQFPLYGGIMGIMGGTGLAVEISKVFVNVATPGSYSVLTFISAALVNFLVPSGGGQWAVQGPIVMESAKAMGADLGRAAMAVAWGGTWTDLLQPFWALPLLAVAGLSIKDVVAYLLVIFSVLGVGFVTIFALT